MTRAARTVDDLYRTHAGEVYRYAYAMLGNRADAEDVTQTTFVNALRSLERGERPRKPSNWLVTIAHNIVRQRWRQQQARPAEVELDRDVALEEPEQEGPSLDDLVQALQRIPHTQREALVMRELEGRSYKEIEAILEITPSALETLLFRARRSLAEELENIVTCERAELAISKRLDGRLSRKDKRRLDEHLRECAGCARLYAGQDEAPPCLRSAVPAPAAVLVQLLPGRTQRHCRDGQRPGDDRRRRRHGGSRGDRRDVRVELRDRRPARRRRRDEGGGRRRRRQPGGQRRLRGREARSGAEPREGGR